MTLVVVTLTCFNGSNKFQCFGRPQRSDSDCGNVFDANGWFNMTQLKETFYWPVDLVVELISVY